MWIAKGYGLIWKETCWTTCNTRTIILTIISKIIESWKTSFFYNLLVFSLYTLGKIYFWIYTHFWRLTVWPPLPVEISGFFYKLGMDLGYAHWKLAAFVNIAAIMHYRYALFWGSKTHFLYFCLLLLPTGSADAVLTSTST